MWLSDVNGVSLANSPVQAGLCTCPNPFLGPPCTLGQQWQADFKPPFPAGFDMTQPFVIVWQDTSLYVD